MVVAYRFSVLAGPLMALGVVTQGRGLARAVWAALWVVLVSVL
jgi:hypothetical protein